MIDPILQKLDDIRTAIRSLRCVYPGEIAVAIHEALPNCDQHQSNGLFAIHQLRVRRPGDKTVYRIIVAPADAPIQIGSVLADEHFKKPIK